MSAGKVFELHRGVIRTQSNVFNPVDTGRKLNEHKTFRRRPGRLLNVLCTFNLRPVFMENGAFLQK